MLARHCLALTLLAATASGGEFNQTLSLGDAAPAWSDLPGVDDRKHSLADVDPAALVVVAFTCNSCPVARDYEDRLMELARRYSGRATFIAVNVNTIPEDRLDRMQARAAERKFNFAYLYDESQQIARDFGASGTPEFFLLSAVSADAASSESQRKVLYMGALDNHSRPDQVTKQYLADAIEAALAGRPPPVGETYASGCRIRYARQRNP